MRRHVKSSQVNSREINSNQIQIQVDSSPIDFNDHAKGFVCMGEMHTIQVFKSKKLCSQQTIHPMGLFTFHARERSKQRCPNL